MAKIITRGDRNIAWIERHCTVPEGKLVGQPVKLSKHQKEWIKAIYDTPTRTFILSMARKNAKTATSAFLLLLHLCGPEARKNSQLVSAAQSKDQAALLFDLAAKIIRFSPDLSQYVLIRDTAKQLACTELGTLYKALSADVATSLGKSPAFVVHDELGQVKGSRSALYESIETACGAQEEPLSIIISTQAPTDNDLLSILIDDALTGADPELKVRLYTAPIDLPAFDEKTIRIANPHFDTFMNKKEVMKSAFDAERMPSRQAWFRNLILNQRVEMRSPFVSRDVWLANTGDPITDFSGRDVYAGLDLASVSDLTALVLISKVNETWHVKPTFWLPSDGLKQKAHMDRREYDVWADQGFLQTTPGAAVQYEYIAEYLRGVFDNCNVKSLAFDRAYMKFLKPWLVKVGFSEAELEKFVEFGQGWVSMSPAIREFEAWLLTNKLEHGDHPVLTMCAANAAIDDKNKNGNRTFAKPKGTDRIDGMVSLAMAIGMAMTEEAEAEPRISWAA